MGFAPDWKIRTASFIADTMKVVVVIAGLDRSRPSAARILHTKKSVSMNRSISSRGLVPSCQPPAGPYAIGRNQISIGPK